MRSKIGKSAVASALAAIAILTIAPLASSCAQAPTRINERGETILDVFRSGVACESYTKLYHAVLAEWPVPYEDLYLPTRFGRTHIIASGPPGAPPLMLLHPLTASAPIWRPNVAALSTSYRVYAVDVIGDINLSEPTRSMKSFDDASAWFTDLLDALKIDRASVVGNSLGGSLALSQVIKTPERIDKVVLISPANIAPLTFEFYKHVAMGMGLGMKKEMSDYFGGGVPWDPNNNAWGALNEYGQSQGRNVNALGGGAVSDEEMRAIKRPVLLLIGDREVIYDISKAIARAKLIPGAETEIVPGANHTAALSKPAEVNARILAFLQKSAF